MTNDQPTAVDVTDGSDISDADVRVFLNRALEEQPRACPICRTGLGAVAHEHYDLGCPACQTKFITNEGNPPKVAMRTTPVHRTKRRMAQADRAREGMAAVAGAHTANVDEQQRTVVHRTEKGNPIPDGGDGDEDCARCGEEHVTGVVGRFPHPTDDEHVWWCVKCWAERVTDETPLTAQEATVVGIREYLDRSVQFAGRVLGRTDAAVRELSRKAHRKLENPDEADSVEPLSALTIVDVPSAQPPDGD